jgi:hypothetical protein
MTTMYLLVAQQPEMISFNPYDILKIEETDEMKVLSR